MKEKLILAAIAIIAVFLSVSAGVAAAYMAVKYGAVFGVALMGFVLGAVLLIDWKGEADEKI